MPGSEMFIRCTMGYCERSDRLPIENLGVVPDVQRWVSLRDMKEGFGAYSRDALDAAVALADGKGAATIQEELDDKHKKANKKDEEKLGREFRTIRAWF